MAEIFATSCVTSGVPMLMIVIDIGAGHVAERNLPKGKTELSGLPRFVICDHVRLHHQSQVLLLLAQLLCGGMIVTKQAWDRAHVPA